MKKVGVLVVIQSNPLFGYQIIVYFMCMNMFFLHKTICHHNNTKSISYLIHILMGVSVIVK